MVRLSVLIASILLLGSCAPDLSVDPTLAESIQQIGMATTGQLEITQEDWVDIAKEACARGAHRDLAVAEQIAEDRGVVFIGTDRPVAETVQVIGEAVCSINEV